MCTTCYKFDEQLKIGKEYEDILDSYYSEWYNITPVSSDMQKIGIDRIFREVARSGFQYSVEYKSDFWGQKTGNAFVEIISIDSSKTPGWAFTMCAQILVYYIPELGKAYRMYATDLKHAVRVWAKNPLYKQKPSHNKGYDTIGICVPLLEFKKHCFGVDKIKNT